MKIGCSRLKYASDKTIKEKLEIWFIKDHSKGKYLSEKQKKINIIFLVLKLLNSGYFQHF